MSLQEIPPEVIPPTGLTVLVVPRERPTLDIVFVHGFNGHPERTWKHKRGDFNQPEEGSGEASEPPFKSRRLNPWSMAHQNKESVRSTVYWPRDLLPATVPSARILTYGYDAHVRHWVKTPVSHNTVRDIAWNFLVALEANRREEPERPLLFIVHSLGGIVVKELLRRSSGCRQGHTHLRSVFETTTGIMFFGTPHGGADPRGVLQHVAELVLKAVGFKVNKEIVNTLLPSSERLKELRDEFSPMAHEQQWKLHSFQEEMGITVLNGDKVVDDTSSYLNLPAIEITEHIRQNHMDMCRFSSPEDVEYKKVVAALQRMTASLPKSRTDSTRPALTEEYRNQLQKSLEFTQIDARRSTIKRAHIKTCKWLKMKEEYLDWLDPSRINEHHGFLWIMGKPGTGKSTLMKFAFDEAQKMMKDKFVLSFFFNSRGEELERSAGGLYRSLLLQLLQHVPGLDTIFDSLRLTVWPQNGRVQWSVEMLKDLFEQALQNLGQSQVVCFIDALDESDEDQIRDMVSFFEHIGVQAIASSIRFQVCFSSRHYPYITIARGLRLVLEGQEGHVQDIANYVSSELKIGHSQVAEEIRAELQDKASGVFMWVVLVVDILNKQFDRGRIEGLRKKLREIPAGLYDLFRDILTRDSGDRDELIACIQWILFAKWPLQPEELYFAVRAATNYELLGPWDRDLTSRFIIERFIVDSSKGLAEITKSKTPVVQFIHESVRDFLLKNNGLQKVWPDLGDHFQGKSHERLKEFCMKYISLDIAGSLRLSGQLPELPEVSSKDTADLRSLAHQSFPFLKYAVCGILYHTDQAESKGVAHNGYLESFPLQRWVHVHNFLERYRIRHCTTVANLLHHAARDGYLSLTKLLLEAGADKDAKDLANRTPLYWAAWHCHLAIIKLLILAGADKEAKDNDGIAPLSRAVGKGHLEVVKFLVEAGADKEVKDRFGLTPLSLATQNGHLGVVRFLVKAGANKAAKDNNGRAPLSWAVIYDNIEAVRFLVEAGADKEAKDDYGRAPLSWAISRGQLEVVKFLVEAGADKEAKDNNGRAPLSWAVSTGQLEFARFLVKAGADREVEDRGRQTPLSLAAKNGYLEAVRFLVEAGADKEAKDYNGQAPLSWAISRGQLEVVKFLVEAGADKEAKDNNGRAPLSWAVIYDNLEAVRFLVEAGADKDTKDRFGQTPLSLAEGNTYCRDIAKLLEKRS